MSENTNANAGANANTNANAKKKKPSLIAKSGRFFRDMKGELKKVVWPSKKQVINNTGVVIVVVICAALVVGGFDALLSLAVKFFLKGA